MKISSFFLSSVLYNKVYDEFNDYMGKLWDIYVTTEDGYPKAIGYKIKKDGEIQNCEFREIGFFKDQKGKYSIKVRGAKEILVRKYSYLLSKHLLDKQIVDITGKKVVRVNDLRMAEIAGELKVIAVDTGVLSICRRLGIEGLAQKIYETLGKRPSDSLIMWDSVESIEMVNESLKLSVPYKKLSKLHPAEIADILEDMNSGYRKKVLESLDENLAADTLEEIEPEIQASIIKDWSTSKALEVLDNMPNDELADLLDEVDKETAEKILMNIEREDAEEVRKLMEYENESVGSFMNRDFIAFKLNITVEEVLDIIRESKPDDESIYYIYVVDEDEKLQGVISLRDLVISPLNSKLRDIMDTNVIKIVDSDDIEDAIELVEKYTLLSLPVVDKEDRLYGIVIMSDIMDEILLPMWKKKFRKVS